MFNPELFITNKILTNIVNIEKEILVLNASDITTQQKIKLKATSKALYLFHAAHMIGYNIGLKDAEKISEGKVFDQENHNVVVLNNIRNLHEFIRSSLQDEYIDIDSSILLHMNKILLSNWKEVWEVRFRNPQLIEDTDWNDWLHLTDKTIEPLTLQDELRSAFDWYKITTQKLYPLIRIAILIYRLIQIAPFSHLNKFTIIGASDFLLRKNGYISEDYLSTFRFFDSNNSLFKDVIAKISIENPNDLTLWVEHFTESLSRELKSVSMDIQEFAKANPKQKKTFLDLNKRQLKILKYLQTIPTIKREDYVQIMEVSTMTAFRDLNDLVTKKLLKVDGRGRATRYHLANR